MIEEIVFRREIKVYIYIYVCMRDIWIRKELRLLRDLWNSKYYSFFQYFSN